MREPKREGRVKGWGGKEIIRMRRVMEKELLNEKMGYFYLRVKGEREQTRELLE